MGPAPMRLACPIAILLLVGQGYALVSDLDTMESWAIAAPRESAFVRRWRDEFGHALTTGVQAYCERLPDSIITRGLRPSLTHGYLAIHAAWRVVRAEMPVIPLSLRSPVEGGQPYRYLAEARWRSDEAVRALFAQPSAELRRTPLLKLRGKERGSVRPLATYGRGSALARTLLAATVPTTVPGRMSFLRCGLDPDAPPRCPLDDD